MNRWAGFVWERGKLPFIGLPPPMGTERARQQIGEIGFMSDTAHEETGAFHQHREENRQVGTY